MAAARSSSATEHNETPVPGLASCRLRPTSIQGLGDMTEFCYIEGSAANVGADCPVGAAWVLESAPALSGPRMFVDTEAPISFCCGGQEDQRIGNLFKQGRTARGALCRERYYSVPSHLWLSQAPRGGNVPITYLSTAVDVLALLFGLCTDTARDSLKIAPSDVKRLRFVRTRCSHCLSVDFSKLLPVTPGSTRSHEMVLNDV